MRPKNTPSEEIELFHHETLMFEYIETVMTSQHIGINDNLEDNKKAVLERHLFEGNV